MSNDGGEELVENITQYLPCLPYTVIGSRVKSVSNLLAKRKGGEFDEHLIEVIEHVLHAYSAVKPALQAPDT